MWGEKGNRCVGLFSFNQFEGLMQDCSNSIANALELLQSCTNPSNSVAAHMVGFHLEYNLQLLSCVDVLFVKLSGSMRCMVGEYIEQLDMQNIHTHRDTRMMGRHWHLRQIALNLGPDSV